jgi:legumain
MTKFAPLMALPLVAESAQWAVIAVGSKGYGNYRHQADGCHAYQVMKKSGIPESNIILMMEDDVADATQNPFPGKLFNKPGNASEDVYAGCKIDYRSSIVTAKLFSSVITGDANGVPRGPDVPGVCQGCANGKVLKSGPNDKVFLNFIDHGGVGIVAFPNGPFMHANTLAQNIKTMQSKKMFKEAVFYMEACESGSMFPDLTKDGKVLAITAANGHESSWGTYCGSQAKVNGKSLETCLGDLFSVSWMEDSDRGALSSETLSTQIQRVTTRTNKSHVSIFGDTSFEKDPIGNFQYKLEASQELPEVTGDDLVNVRDIDVHLAFDAWSNAKTPEAKREAWKHLMSISAAREADEALFENIVKTACSDVNMIGCVDHFRHARTEFKDMVCHQKLAETVFEDCPRSKHHFSPGGWNGFNMRFSQVLVNLCEGQEMLGKDTQKFTDIVKSQCFKAKSQMEGTQVVV